MGTSVIGLGFLLLFLAAIWIILMLWTIYKTLKAILSELQNMNRNTDI